MVAPEVARMAAASAGQVVVAKVDTEQVPELAQRYDIRSIPAFLLFSRGREENRLLGARPADELQAFARQAI